MATVNPTDTCSHGYTPYSGGGTAALGEELSSCCGAHVTFSGDGDLYCKCCYGSIEWA